MAGGVWPYASGSTAKQKNFPRDLIIPSAIFLVEHRTSQAPR